MNIRSRLILLTTLVFLFGGMILMILASQMDDSIWKPIFGSIGSFISVTIILGFLYKVLVKEYDDDALEKRLVGVFEKQINQTFVGNVHYGLEGFLDSISFEEVFDSLNTGETLWWLDTYDPSYHRWLDSLKEALGRGAKLKFLVMDPDSPLLEMRAAELGSHFTAENFRQDLNSFIVNLNVSKDNAKDDPGSIEIVKYKDLPCAPMYIIEKNGVPIRAYSSLFLGEATALGFPHIIWRSSPGSYISHMYQYVKSKWDRNSGKKIDSLKDSEIIRSNK